MAKQILCIEDDNEMRIVIRFALESVGYEIHEAENGKEGLERALKLLPNLILCDIQMPMMDGFETFKELRNHKATANIPFIFMTGESPLSYMRKGMNLGADDFIMKPFEMDDLIKAVQIRLQEAERTKEEAQQTINKLSENITRALPHELRTPMTGILGFAELLKTQAEELDTHEVKFFAQSLFDSAIRMNQTLEKFWIYTQCLLLPIDHAKLSVSRQTGSNNADRIIQKVAKELANTYNRYDDLIINISSFSLAISERYLDQVIRQVIDNAFKFSTTGTEIIISTISENNFGIITVKDNGRGMSEEQIHKINTFIQFDREQHEQQGLGLGLMIAKRLTETHNGIFHIIGAQNTGTTVTLSFPLL